MSSPSRSLSPRAGDDQHAGGEVALARPPEVVELLEHLLVDGVDGLGPVVGEDADLALGLVDQSLVVHRAPPGSSHCGGLQVDSIPESGQAAHDFSASVACTNGQNIIAERPMYFNYQPGMLNWTGGTDVVGLVF